MTIQRTTRARRVPGFTVVELLVAIAVLAVVSVGLSVIFGTVGDAVTDGRRVSELNRASARIEQQIRDDLADLTRDGFLVITNRYASDENGVPIANIPADPSQPGIRLSPRQAEGRSRRADEMMFFARGDFETKRPPVSSGVTAKSSEAAIYYGLGQKRPINILANAVDSPANFYFNPSPRDPNLIADRLTRYPALLGLPEPSGQLPNPNRYAADWSLLRQVTLLAEPQIASVLPEQLYGLQRTRLADRTLMLDSARQIGMQPAARSIFNSLTWTDTSTYAGSPGSTPADGLSRWWIGDIADYGGSGGLSPADASLPAWRSSGVVDIAQGSILGIRRKIEALSAFAPPSAYYAPSEVNPVNTRRANFGESADGFAAAWNDHTASPRPIDATGLNILTSSAQRFNLRAWALDMLPSLWNGESNPPTFLAGVRYEDLPTRLVYDDNRFPDSNAGRLGRAISEANQEMLASQILVPRCSEFIVEWTYGFIDPTLPPNDPRFKQIVWYGLPRADRDVNNDGRIELDDHAVVAAQIARRYEPRVPTPPNTEPDPVRERVALAPSDVSLVNPEVVVFGLTDVAGAPGDAGQAVPWPRMIRITMSLADPDDETIERSYQFVFAIPGELN